jgi:hypothetical protein
MPKLSDKMQRLQHVFPDFGAYDEFVKGCSQAMEALHVLSNERDVVGARVCMTDTMFDMWQQAIAAAQSEDHAVDITQCKVLNACVVNVAIDETKARVSSPTSSFSTQFNQKNIFFVTPVPSSVTPRSRLHTSTCYCMPPRPKSSRYTHRAHSKSRKIVKHSPFVFRILRFCSEGAALDWKLHAHGPPGAPPQQKQSSS